MITERERAVLPALPSPTIIIFERRHSLPPLAKSANSSEVNMEASSKLPCFPPDSLDSYLVAAASYKKSI